MTSDSPRPPTMQVCLFLIVFETENRDLLIDWLIDCAWCDCDAVFHARAGHFHFASLRCEARWSQDYESHANQSIFELRVSYRPISSSLISHHFSSSRDTNPWTPANDHHHPIGCPAPSLRCCSWFSRLSMASQERSSFNKIAKKQGETSARDNGCQSAYAKPESEFSENRSSESELSLHCVRWVTWCLSVIDLN